MPAPRLLWLTHAIVRHRTCGSSPALEIRPHSAEKKHSLCHYGVRPLTEHQNSHLRTESAQTQNWGQVAAYPPTAITLAHFPQL